MTIPGYIPSSQETDPAKLARSIRNLYENAPSFEDVDAATVGSRSTPGGRITLSTGVPIMLSTVAATGTIYYTPYLHNVIWLHNGTTWVSHEFAEISLALSAGTASKLHDVWCYSNAGTATLELTAWTNDTTRATGLVRQNGTLVKSGDSTRLYLGTIYLDGSKQSQWTFGSSASGGGAAQLDVWNYYNRNDIITKVTDSGVPYTYGTATIRQRRASAGNQVTFVIGVQEDHVSAISGDWAIVAASGAALGFGVGLDSTSTFASQDCILQSESAGGVTAADAVPSILSVGIGRHIISANETSYSGTNTHDYASLAQLIVGFKG